MIIIYPTTDHIFLPKYDRSRSDANGVYQLILQHRYTKSVYVCTVTDSIPRSRDRYRFEITTGLISGEYTYYLVSYDAWKRHYIDRNYVPLSTRKLKVNAIGTGDILLRVGNSLIVTGRIHESAIGSGGLVIATDAGVIVADDPGYVAPAATSEEKFETGMCVEMCLLGTGIIKAEGCDPCAEPAYRLPNEENEYVQYHG